MSPLQGFQKIVEYVSGAWNYGALNSWGLALAQNYNFSILSITLCEIYGSYVSATTVTTSIVVFC